MKHQLGFGGETTCQDYIFFTCVGFFSNTSINTPYTHNSCGWNFDITPFFVMSTMCGNPLAYTLFVRSCVCFTSVLLYALDLYPPGKTVHRNNKRSIFTHVRLFGLFFWPLLIPLAPRRVNMVANWPLASAHKKITLPNR